MGKVAIILGILLITSISGSAWYIDRLQDNIATLKGNAIALENSIAEQNKAIEEHMKRAKNLQDQNNTVSAQNQESAREVNKLRQTFANHDLDNLALAKPELIQGKINRAVKRLKEELETITDPDQFDEEPTDS